MGVNIHDPKYGVWWEARDHLKNAKVYNETWGNFLEKDPSFAEILAKGRAMMKEYGIKVRY